MRSLILNYDKKHGLIEETKAIYTCTHLDTRNRYKNDKYKIPFDKPQCPTFKDNRCCGGCRLAPECDDVVNCNCFGFCYATMGGTDEKNYMKKCSKYYGVGRIGKDGKFDWDYYKLNKFKLETQTKKFLILNIEGKRYVSEIKSRVKNDGSFKCFIKEIGCYKNVKFENLESYPTLYETYKSANRWVQL